MPVPKKATKWLGKSVCVIWLDATFGLEGGTDLLKPTIVMTFGLLHEITDEYVRLHSEFFVEEDKGRQATAVPIGMVQKIIPWPQWTIPAIVEKWLAANTPEGVKKRARR
jgi:hypothetical protein